MKAPIISLALASSLCIGFAGCSSSHAVKSELSDASVKLYRDASYGVKIADAGGNTLDFGPRERRQAMTSLRAELVDRSVSIAEDVSKANYVISFGTYSESETERYASVFPEHRVYAYSTPRGIDTPLGPVVTGHNTHTVETETSMGVTAFRDAGRVFVVDITDPTSGELLWRGYTRRGSVRLDTDRLEEEIAKLVEAMPLADRKRGSSESDSQVNDRI